ncbi:hypothetical protein LTS18_007352, partial [Coniosporium uncinatum]
MDVAGAYTLTGYSRYREWIYEKGADPVPRPFTFSDLAWTKVLLQERWCVISGSYHQELEAPLETPRPKAPAFDPSKHLNRTPSGTSPTEMVSQFRSLGTAETPQDTRSNFDWTNEEAMPHMSEFVKWARSVDWASTPLGPMESWSTELRLSSNMAMKDTAPSVVFWGPELVMLYNEAYIALLGDLHPLCMGNSAKTVLKDVWGHFAPIVEVNRTTGQAVEEANVPIFIDRGRVRLEETYFSYRFIPVCDMAGQIVGHHQIITESTSQNLSNRRSSTLLAISEETARARDHHSFWGKVTEALAQNDKD